MKWLSKVLFGLKTAVLSSWALLKSGSKQIYLGNKECLKRATTRKKVIYSSVFLLFSATVCSMVLCCQNFESGITATLTEIAEEQHKGNNATVGVSYYFPSVSSDAIVYLQPEKTKQMRNMYESVKFLDAYVNGFRKVSIWSKAGGSSDSFSLVAWPKANYHGNVFKYPLPLLEGSVKNVQDPKTVYVYREFADKVIAANPSLLTYKDLLGYSIDITINDFSLSMSVGGVIDSDSEQYAEIADSVGNFFAVSENLSLPVPSLLFFKVSSSQLTNYQVIRSMLGLFKYESEKTYVGSDFVDKFQHRITFAVSREEILAIFSDAKGEACSRTDLLFDHFLQGKNILRIGLFGFLVLLLLIVTIVCCSHYLADMAAVGDFPTGVVTLSLHQLAGLGLGLLIATLFHLTPFFSFISIKNYVALLVCIAAVVLVDVLAVFCSKKIQRTEKSNNH